MNQRLIWNFEFSSKKKSLPAELFVENEQDNLKWESRFFWPFDQIIVLRNLDESLLDIANYQQKHREDSYFLLPDTNYNIKQRRNELLYKPQHQKTAHAIGFGSKINLGDLSGYSENEAQLEEIKQRIEQEGIRVFVKKEAFIYKFPTKPSIKLELARIDVLDNIYFSACIEGKSRQGVETVSKYLLGEHVSCDYVTFLQNILK